MPKANSNFKGFQVISKTGGKQYHLFEIETVRMVYYDIKHSLSRIFSKKGSTKNCGNLVFVSTIILTVSAVHANLLVVLLQGSHVLPGLRELSLLHALPDIPVDESSL